MRIKDGGTAIVAGLTENRNTRSDKRVPGFSSLPLIGDLFKSKSDESASREIAVFVTANIVSNDQVSAGFMGQQAPMTFTPAQQMNPAFNQQSQFNQQQPYNQQPMYNNNQQPMYNNNQQPTYNQQQPYNQQQMYNQQQPYRTPAEMTPINPFQQELINSTRTR